MPESYTLPECTSKPRYEGIFVTSKKRAILKNWTTKLETKFTGREKKWIA